MQEQTECVVWMVLAARCENQTLCCMPTIASWHCHLLHAAKESANLHADIFAIVQWLNPSINKILNNIQRASLRTKLYKSYEGVQVLDL
jgi:hypothetical protein